MMARCTSLSQLLIVLVVCLHPAWSGACPLGDAQVYLAKYNYLEKKKVDATMRTSELMDKETLTNAIREFQEFAGLPETGEPDEETLQMMYEPRCGVSDGSHGYTRRSKRYTLLGSKWKKEYITYKILTYSRQMTQQDTDYWIMEAFKVWMAVTPLQFKQIYWEKADIEIVFKGYNHGDPYPFDGEGGTLAHAFQPGEDIGGDAHFDDSEVWILRNPNMRGSDLFSVAVHEFGHSLGLGHSKQSGSIMRPFYSYVMDSKATLTYDDISAVQSLYGPNKRPPIYPTTTPRPKPTAAVPTTPPPRPVPDFCHKSLHFDAMVGTTSGNTYAFVGWQHVYIWNGIDLDPTAPKLTSEVFSSLHWGADAAFSLKWGNREMIYIIFAWFVWIYDAKDLRLLHTQVPMNMIFPDLPYQLDAALQWGQDGNVYMFKGSQYWKMEQIRDDRFKAMPGYPRPASDLNLPIRTINAALFWPINSRTYFFSGEEYYKYDHAARKAVAGYPRSMKVWWLHCPDPPNGFNIGSTLNAREGLKGSSSATPTATIHSSLHFFVIVLVVLNIY